MAKKKQRDPGGDGDKQRRRELADLERRLEALMATDERQRDKLARTQEQIAAVKERLRELGAGTPAVVVAYCLRERRKVELTDFVPMTLRNGRSAVAGTCPGCGMRIVSLAARQA